MAKAAWKLKPPIGPSTSRISPQKKRFCTRFDSMAYAPGGDNTWTELPAGASWNRSETLHIVVTLPVGNQLATGKHTIRVSSPNGIVADRVFSR